MGGTGIDGTIGGQVSLQFIGVLATAVYCAIVTYVILKIVDATIGLRVSDEAEQQGLDLVLHDEQAYNINS